MISSNIDSIDSGKFPFLVLTEKILSETKTGYLIVDKNYEIIAVNNLYKLFHNLYNEKSLQVGKILTDQDFLCLPESVLHNLKKVFAGHLESVNLQIEHLSRETLSYKLTISYLSDIENNFEGACLTVQKREIAIVQGDNSTQTSYHKLLIDSSSTVYQFADAALVYTYTSNAISNILGYTPKEMNGKNAIELVHPDDKDNVRDWLIEIRRRPEIVLTLEYRIKNKSGDFIWIENNARNMLADPNIKAVIMNFRNIQAKKVADNALIQSEQRLSLLLNNTEESFIILNSRLRILTYNKAAQDRSPFFYNAPLQSGMSVLDLISRNEISAYIEMFELVFNGEEIEKETKFIDSEGMIHVYSHTFRPLFDGQTDIFGVFITSTEITERKKLTEELALNSERLKAAQKIARLGYFEYDFNTKICYCSEQFCEILGIPDDYYSWQQLSSFQSMIHSEDHDSVLQGIQKSVVDGKDFSLEFRCHTNNGIEKIILAIGSVEKNDTDVSAKFKVTLQDITDSKMAILAIQTLESKFKSLFDNSIDGVILSSENGDIISANPSVCQMLGYSQSELVALKSCDLLDVNTTLVKKMFQIRKEDNGAFIGELLLKHRLGHFVPVEVTSISMKDGNDNPYVSTIIRDITEKKKIESEQKALSEELLKNNQDLQQFSFITSHNLRAPVANLLSLLSLYNNENPADDFNQILVEKFKEATMQLNATLNDLVNVLVIKSSNNIERENISFTDIYLVVKKNIDNLLKQQNGEIFANFSEVDEIQYNRIHIESIFLNMISNAIRYSSPDRKPEIKIRSYKQNNWVIVEFEDNGLGMDLKRYGDRLFGLYQRFHGHKEGKGLGLYMTRSQVIAMGGKIEVESEAGVGTTFKIFFKI